MSVRAAPRPAALSPGRMRWAVDLPILAGLLLCWLALKSFGLGPAVSDENIYFYDAWLMSQGELPYRDFFFAHPPLGLIPGWVVFALLGKFDPTALKLLPVAASALSGALVYALTRRVGGVIGAVVAACLFLFSHDLLRASSHWTGINASVMWLVFGMALGLRGRGALAGGALALGVCTGVYVAPAALSLLGCMLLADTRSGVRALACSATVWLGINALFLSIGGEGYIDGVYRYHLLKPAAVDGGLLTVVDQLLFHNFFVLAAPLFLAPLLVGPGRSVLRARGATLGMNRGGRSWRELFDPRRQPLLATGIWCLLSWASTLFFLWLLGRVFHFYFLLLFPAGAVAGGLFAARFAGALRSSMQERRARLRAGAMLVAIILGVLLQPHFKTRLTYFPKLVGKVKSYEWPSSPLPEFLQSPMKRLLWTPDREVGARYSGVQFYLWHESRELSEIAQMGDLLRRNASAGETIFGDSTTTGLVALHAGIRISDDFADSNAMRFHAGLPSAVDAVARLEGAMHDETEPLRWIFISPQRGVAKVEPIAQFIEDNFRTIHAFRSRYFGVYLLMRRR